jgi:hypothetical protein
MLRIHDWLQLAASLAMLAGIGLVVLELRQSQSIAQAQIISDSYAIGAANVSTVLGEGAADVLARACTAPESLSHEDLVIAKFYYTHRIALVRRLASISRGTGVYPDSNWQDYARNIVLPEVFDSEIGRAWWRVETPAGELGEIGDAMLEALGPPKCGERLLEVADLVGAAD